MRLAAWLCGLATITVLGLIWMAWQINSHVQLEPDGAGHLTAVAWTLILGGTPTVWLALASRRPSVPARHKTRRQREGVRARLGRLRA